MKEVTSLKVKSKPSKKTEIGKNIYLPIFTFIFTLFLVFAAFALNDMVPFGRYSMLVSDLKGQYAPNIIRLKAHLKAADPSDLISSLTYSNSFGGGKNIISTFAYYVASPFNLLMFLFDDAQIGSFIAVICSLRLAFGAAFMCMFLQNRASDKNSNWPLVFAITYSFSSYSIIFLFNILWFDAFMLLPLLYYLVDKFIESEKKIGIAIVLIFLFISNFYASYMAGVASFFYLLGRLVYFGVIENKMTLKNAFSKVWKFVLLAICCILTIGAFIVPVGMDVLAKRDVTSDLEEENLVQFKGIEILDQIFYGNVGEFDTLIGNLPFIFVSLSVTFLIAIFFVSKIFETKEKYFYGTVFVLIYVSFNITVIDKIWQAFDTPNWFHHRYSFVFLPIFIALAYRVFEKIKEIKNSEILKALAILIGILLVTQSFGKIADKGSYFIMNICLLAVYTFIFMALKREKWPEQLKNMQKLSAGLLAVFIIFETAGMGPKSSDQLSAYTNGMPDAGFKRDIMEIQSLAPYAKAYNDGYRICQETAGKKPKDIWIKDASEVEAYTGLNGISIFDSCSNRKYARFIKQIGYQLNFNYAAFDCTYSSLPTDAFFSIGNVITNSEYSNATLVSSDAKGHYFRSYQNKNVLPVGFAAYKHAPNFNFYMMERLPYGKDYFDFQNRWYKSMFPSEFHDDFWVGRQLVTDENIVAYNCTKIPFDEIDSQITGKLNHDDPIGDEPETKSIESRNAYFRLAEKAPTALTITCKAIRSGEQYVCITASSLMSNTHIYQDNQEIFSAVPNSFYSTIVRLGYFEEGEEIKITLTSTDKIFSYQDIYFAALDSEVFNSQFEKLDLNKVVVDRYSNGVAEFTTNLGEDDILLTTIPYENGWKCYIDGKETEIKVYEDALMYVEPGTGTHKVEFKFTAPGLYAGVAVSGVGLIALVAFIAVTGKKSKQKTENKQA